MSLRLRLTLFYTLFLAVVLVAVAGAVYAFTQRTLVTTLEDKAEELVTGVAVAKKLSVIQPLPDDAYYIIKTDFLGRETREALLSAQTTSAYFYSRNIVRRPPSEIDLFKFVPEKVYDELFASKRAFTQLAIPNTSVKLIVYLRLHDLSIFETPERPAISLLALPFPNANLNSLRNLILRTVLLAFITFAVGVWLLSARVLLPLKRVTETAALINSRDLSQRVPCRKPTTNSENSRSRSTTCWNACKSRLKRSGALPPTPHTSCVPP